MALPDQRLLRPPCMPFHHPGAPRLSLGDAFFALAGVSQSHRSQDLGEGRLHRLQLTGSEMAGKVFLHSFEVDREDWGMTWNVALESGGVLVGKKVRLEIEAEAIRQK
jgi:hypothetical protein